MKSKTIIKGAQVKFFVKPNALNIIYDHKFFEFSEC